MTFLDGIFFVVALAFITFGFTKGFIHTVGNLIAWVIGVAAASWLVKWLISAFDLSQPWWAIIFFLIALGIITRFIGSLVALLDATWKLFRFIPFTGMVNHVLGGIVGILEVALLVFGIALLIGLFFADTSLYETFTSTLTFSWAIHVIQWARPVLEPLFL